MEFRDRVANKPNRVRLTYEEGGASVYATVELADEPIDEGTPLNALNMNKLLNKENTDYIIEQGTKEVDGVTWTYEKWNSGTFKMWGMVTATYIDPYLLTKEGIIFPVELAENAIGFATVNEFLPSSPNSTKTPTILCKTNRCSVQVHNHFGNFTSTSTANVAVQVIGKWRYIHRPNPKK